MVRRNEKNMMGETEVGFTLAMFLMNVLILAVIGGVSWLLHAALTENNSFNLLVRGEFLR